MAATLAQFTEACHRLLADAPGVAGREKLCALTAEVLKDEAFVAAYLDTATSERQLLYEDPALHFCVLAHAYEGARESQPHDHGPSWAIYGQARGETEMSDFALVEPAAPGQPGKVRFLRSYWLKPGMAHLYNEGDLHAPRRAAATRLLRIEGQNLETVARLHYRRI